MIKITLLGDSITEYMPYMIDKRMKRGFNVPMVSSKLPISDIVFYICGVSNIGIGTYHNYIWPKVANEETDCFILLIGINNLLRPDCDYDGKESLDDAFEKMKLFIQDIIKSGKDLLIQLLYPTDKITINKMVIEINDKIKKYCEENHIDYLDLYDLLSNDNKFIKSTYTYDGLHPNEYGYRIIIDEISKKIKEKNKQMRKLCR